MTMYLKLLSENLNKGSLLVTVPDGTQHKFGNGKGPSAHWVIHDEKALSRVARNPEFELGEAYMQGAWDFQDCSLYDLLTVLRINFAEYEAPPWMQPILRLVQQFNRVSRSYRNVAHHYDLDEAFFRLFLDDEMHYSCAYFTDEDTDIHSAQQAKCEHIAKKLLLKPGMDVLDIGCGWGSLAIYLAERHGVRVTGITLSKAQLAVAQRRARERGLEKQVKFELCDYREHEHDYDRIVSVGMFEHVGAPFYKKYFERVETMLRDSGVAMIHTIGRSTPPGLTNPWINKYIFPGGSIPALSETMIGVEKARLMLTDAEIWRLHYADTLAAWNTRFQVHRDAVREERGESFCRMWEFYLTSCEMSFRHSDLVVFQLQMAKQHGVVPNNREYLHPNPLLEKMPRNEPTMASQVHQRERESVAS